MAPGFHVHGVLHFCSVVAVEVVLQDQDIGMNFFGSEAAAVVLPGIPAIRFNLRGCVAIISLRHSLCAQKDSSIKWWRRLSAAVGAMLNRLCVVETGCMRELLYFFSLVFEARTPCPLHNFV